MGFFSMNEHSNLGNIEFPTLEGYCGTVGAGIALVEGYENDMALFTASIQADFSETAAIKEGADLEPLQEASIAGAGQALKNFFVKLGAKIKSIFMAFISKIESYMGTDTKKYVERYRKQVFNGKGFDKMKAKYSEPTHDTYQNGKMFSDITINISDAANITNTEDLREDTINEYLSACVEGTVDGAKEFAEKYHEECFKDEEVKDNWSVESINTIANRLVSNQKLLTEVRKKNDSLQSSIKKVIVAIDKEVVNVAKKFPEKGSTQSSTQQQYKVASDANTGKYSFDDGKTGNGSHSGSNTDLQKALGKAQIQASAIQAAIMTYSQCLFKEIKFGLAQDRRIYAQAVAYHSRNLKEDASLLEAIGEAAEWDAMTEMDAFDYQVA